MLNHLAVACFVGLVFLRLPLTFFDLGSSNAMSALGLFLFLVVPFFKTSSWMGSMMVPIFVEYFGFVSFVTAEGVFHVFPTGALIDF